MKQIGIAGMMVAMLFMMVPGVVGAQEGEQFPNPGTIGENPSNPGTIGENPSNPGTIGENPHGLGILENPIEADSLIGFLREIIRVIRIFATPIIVFFIIYAGFLLATSRGNPAQISKGKEVLLYALIGGVIIVGAELILEVIQNTVTDLTK